jgi:hypothetical protein
MSNKVYERFLGLLLISILIISCSQEDKYDTGYSDGYAAGYNTTCQIRVTLIEGDWENQSYSSGYNAGYSQGSIDCREKR